MTSEARSASGLSSADRRREKLTAIQKREEMKDALVEKFKSRYQGTEALERLSTPAINREVTRFCNTASMTQKNLQRLDRRMAGQVEGKTPSECDAVSEYSISAYTSSSKTPSCGSRSARGQGPLARMAAKSLEERGGSETGSQSARGTKPAEDFDWSTLDKYAAHLHQQDALRQRAGQVELKNKLRSDLDQQLADRKVRKQREIEDAKAYHNAMKSDFENYQKLEEEQKKVLRDKAEKEKKERDAQLVYERNARDQEKARLDAEAHSLTNQIEQELELERQRIERKKIDQKDYMAKVQAENQKEILQRNNAVKLEKEKDVEMMAEYVRKLEKQDEDRAKALADRMEKQKQLTERMGAAMLENAQKHEEEFAKRAEKQRKEKDEATIKYERERDQNRKKTQQQTQAFLFEQMDEKERDKKARAEQKKKQGAMLQQDTDDYYQSEQMREKSRRDKNFEHRAELEKQIATKAPPKRHAMSESEVAMNKALLELVSKSMPSVPEEGQ